MTPLVSVVVPVKNGEAFLRAALQSVLDQNTRRLQLIVVDDGSDDGSAEVAAAFGPAIGYIYQASQGPAAARNAGLAVALGAFVAFNDADDVWLPGRLARQLQYLQEHPDCDIVQGQIRHLQGGENVPELLGEPFFALSLGSGLFRREAFSRVGPLDASLTSCEDMDWFFRALEAGLKVESVPGVVLHHRRHEHNLTNQRQRLREATLRVVWRHRQRRKPRP